MFPYLNKNQKKGFSVIELIIGITIMVTVMTIILTVIISAFRISAKTAVSDSARQNGNYAMNRLIKMIQFADSFNGGTDSGLDTAGFAALTLCNYPGVNNYKSININYNGAQKVMQCRTSDKSIHIITSVNPPVITQDEKLINSDNIDVSNCNFTCRRVTATASPVITISFDLSVGDTNTLVENRVIKIPFRTSVKMRNQ